MGKFSNQTVIITGSGRGLGKEAALHFAKEGASLLINDIQKEIANQTADEMRKLGVRVSVSTHNVAKHEEVQELVKQADEELGGLSVLVNNAGILRDSMLHKLSESDWDSVIQVNLKGVFNCTQAFVQRFKEKNYRGGAIVNLSSIAAFGNVGQTNYSAAKAGVIGMTKTWALELSKLGIRVNAIAPGMIKTDMTKGMPEEIQKALLSRIPLRRMGEPDDVAKALLFLAGPDSSYITGEVLRVCGGAGLGI